MAEKETRGSAERPLQGVVLCFTSFKPEERTRYADLAVQMGAQHKLDLTSDTTHLIVGSTDTEKYQYVAREREDIKVLRPEWVEAVRELWINDLPLDLEGLTREYRLPTLAGLRICITGFEDLSFRAQLQKNIVENGGEYTGDLTRDVTHLIAAKPEGKKYEYGMQWQSKVVSLKWYKDSLDRGMQLDESLYHPTIPVDQQGVGAWNRRVQPTVQLGKRARDDAPAAEPSRKLRRTASAKLGGQTQNLWTDIVAGAGFETKQTERLPLKPSVSMPAMRQAERLAVTTSEDENNTKTVASEPSPTTVGFLSGRLFIVESFDRKRGDLLRKILLENGAKVIEGEHDQHDSQAGDTLLIVPHDFARNKSGAQLLRTDVEIVSELWLERCMLQRTFIPPQAYPLGLLVQGPRTKDFSGLTINATGFDALETLHISKMVALLGGKYTEIFTPSVSVLLCKVGKLNQAKLDLAQHSGIPCVSEKWLWSTMRNGRKAPVESYVIQQHSGNATGPDQKRHSLSQYVEVSTIPINPESRERKSHGRGKVAPNRTDTESHTRSASKATKFPIEVHDESAEEQPQGADHTAGPQEDIGMQEVPHAQDDLPLQELSNSSGRSARLAPSEKQSIPPFDGNSSMQGTKSAEPSKARGIQAINGAIRDILERHTRKKQKPAESKGPGDEPVKKSRLIGRALSNLSNSSATSDRLRNSRASSVDSINTDGLGSELIKTHTENSTGEGVATSERGNYSFTGRAKSTLTGIKAHSVIPDDLDLAHGSHHTEEAPPMTQLGYEDPEEAVLLRQKLVGSRQKRSKRDDNNGEPEAEAAPPKVERKLRDDVLLTSAGWGTGRRTRQKQKSPPGLKEF
ncbi:hypothetical protein ABEF92_004369 [Exophiala dermatitidis]